MRTTQERSGVPAFSIGGRLLGERVQRLGTVVLATGT